MWMSLVSPQMSVFSYSGIQSKILLYMSLLCFFNLCKLWWFLHLSLMPFTSVMSTYQLFCYFAWVCLRFREAICDPPTFDIIISSLCSYSSQIDWPLVCYSTHKKKDCVYSLSLCNIYHLDIQFVLVKPLYE